MFRSSYLKLYRKFLILAVLLGGLFIAASVSPQHTNANFCCMFCPTSYSVCLSSCEAIADSPVKYAQCLTECDYDYEYCQEVCTPFC
jgi:hypothetical protein